MITLEEAIKHCKDIALSCTNKECALEHFQLLKWLQEYSNMLEKQGEQKPAEWSEEDENNINSIISRLEVDISYWESRSKIRTNEDKKLIDWLKSLRPQNTWKPSSEQMDALYTYIYNPQYFNSPDPRMELVESLYNDLKKLKV